LKLDIEPHERIREYLLGQSRSDDAEQVEDRLLTDDDLYQQVLIVEDELVDQFVAGLLTESDRESFEKYFLAAPERRQKLRFALNLKKYVSRAEADRASLEIELAPRRAAIAAATPLRKQFWSWSNPVLSYSFAGAAVLVLVVAAVVVIRNLNAPPKAPGKVMVVELTPGLSRGDKGPKEISVPADTATVQLQLRNPNTSAYQTYRAILQSSEGREISRQDNLPRDPASNDRITYQVPASLLRPGEYNLKLSGVNQQGGYVDLARYSFLVTNK
jgi:hypothetical protein